MKKKMSDMGTEYILNKDSNNQRYQIFNLWGNPLPLGGGCGIGRS